MSVCPGCLFWLSEPGQLCSVCLGAARVNFWAKHPSWTGSEQEKLSRYLEGVAEKIRSRLVEKSGAEDLPPVAVDSRCLDRAHLATQAASDCLGRPVPEGREAYILQCQLQRALAKGKGKTGRELPTLPKDRGEGSAHRRIQEVEAAFSVPEVQLAKKGTQQLRQELAKSKSEVQKALTEPEIELDNSDFRRACKESRLARAFEEAPSESQGSLVESEESEEDSSDLRRAAEVRTQHTKSGYRPPERDEKGRVTKCYTCSDRQKIVTKKAKERLAAIQRKGSARARGPTASVLLRLHPKFSRHVAEKAASIRRKNDANEKTECICR